MSDLYVGERAANISVPPKFDAISKVVLLVDDENYYEAGNGTGRTLELTCPYGTQEMANNILASVSGYQYQPVTATDALADPAVELGDSMTVGGAYSIVAQREIDFGLLLPMELAAPGQEEIESEYPYVSQQQSETNRQLAQTRSEIRKTSEEIGLRVDGLSDQYAELKLTLDGVTITDDTGTTKINGSAVYTDNLYVNAANVKGKLTANQIDATNLKVNAANITGSLTIGQLPSNVATSSDIPTKTSDLTNDSGYQTRSGVVSIIDGTVTADYVEALDIAAATLRGRTIYIQNNYGSSVGYISTSSADSGGSAIDINSYGAGRFEANGNLHFNGNGTVLELVSGYIGCGRTLRPASTSCDLGTSGWLWGDIYATNGTINTSDRNRKTDISYDMSRYEAIFDALKPANFKMIDGTSGRTHTGFISQDIEDALAPCGLTSIDFATFIKSPKVDEDGKVIEGEYVYGLRYDELIALMVTQIQSLKKRVADLEVAHG